MSLFSGARCSNSCRDDEHLASSTESSEVQFECEQNCVGSIRNASSGEPTRRFPLSQNRKGKGFKDEKWQKTEDIIAEQQAIMAQIMSEKEKNVSVSISSDSGTNEVHATKERLINGRGREHTNQYAGDLAECWACDRTRRDQNTSDSGKCGVGGDDQRRQDAASLLFRTKSRLIDPQDPAIVREQHDIMGRILQEVGIAMFDAKFEDSGRASSQNMAQYARSE